MEDYCFYSIDRLVEFGLGMAIARQMVDVMNETMRTMYVPGSVSTIPSPQAKPIYVAVDGCPVGPLTQSELATMAAEKRITKDSLVWMPGMIGWKPFEQVPEVLRIIALTPPPLPTI